MPVVKFVESESTEHEVDISVGQPLMEGATQAGIEGIVAVCGGSCSCATCHVYVDEDWVSKLGQADSLEVDMLEMAVDPKPNGRLSCQVTVTEELHG